MPMSLKEMRDVDVRTVNPADLVNIKKVKVNTSLPRDERLYDFLNQIRNPYLFLCDNTVVKVSFADTTATLEDRLERYLLSI